jgi:hypothetical protein
VPLVKTCLSHGTFVPGSPPIPNGRCPLCYRADKKRRARKQQAAGRTTGHWRLLKAQAKANASYRCQGCGKKEERHSRGWLSVHLRPELNGNHRVATLSDVVVLCLSCHGAVDTPRATRRQVNSRVW